MVTFSCDGDGDIITDVASSSSSSANTTSNAGSNNNHGSSSSSSEQLQQPLQSTSSSLQKKTNKVVTFSEIHIWEFETCVGDNPSLTTGGCPVALSNQPHTRATSMPVEEAETLRESPFYYRRSANELILNRDAREERYVLCVCSAQVCMCANLHTFSYTVLSFAPLFLYFIFFFTYRLLASGCTRKEIAAGVRKARKERHARDLSSRNRGEWDKVQEAVETARRKLTKPFRVSSMLPGITHRASSWGPSTTNPLMLHDNNNNNK
jgi:hypothetical protein